MVQLQYVVKRKRRKLAALISLIGTIIVTSFGIISFLGNKTGSFTISLYNDGAVLSLSEHSDFVEKTSFLRVDELKGMYAYCYHSFLDINDNPDFSEIDNEDYSYNEKGAVKDVTTQEILGYTYFKYTFFIKNTGSITAQYDMEINILGNSLDDLTQKRIDDFIRCGVIEDGNPTFYAKRSNDATHYETGKESEQTNLEYLCCDPTSITKNHGLANPFVSESTICRIKRTGIKPDEYTRYTLLFWIEGDDEEARGYVPLGCKLRLGVEIQAYGN